MTVVHTSRVPYIQCCALTSIMYGQPGKKGLVTVCPFLRFRDESNCVRTPCNTTSCTPPGVSVCHLQPASRLRLLLLLTFQKSIDTASVLLSYKICRCYARSAAGRSSAYVGRCAAMTTPLSPPSSPRPTHTTAVIVAAAVVVRS